MTRKKDLKRHVRERAEKTGESYMAAREQVLRAREPEASPPKKQTMKEFMDESLRTITATPREIVLGTYLGLKCAVRPSMALLMSGLAQRALDGFKLALEALSGDPAAVVLRGAVFNGAALPILDLWRGSAHDDPQLIAMLARIKGAGLLGLGSDGRSLAFLLDDRVVIARAQRGWSGGKATVMLHVKDEYAWMLSRL